MSLTANSEGLTLNEPLRTNEGTYPLDVSDGDLNTSVAGIGVKKNKKTTVTLGSLEAPFDPADLTVDLGPTASVKLFATPGWLGDPAEAPPPRENEIWSWADGYTLEESFAGKTTKAQLVAPGATFRFAWNLPVLASPASKTVAEGEAASVPLLGADRRAKIVVEPPADRDLPDAQLDGCQTSDRTFVIQRSTTMSNVQGEPAPYDQMVYARNASSYAQGYVSSYSTRLGIEAYRALHMGAVQTLRVFPFAATEQMRWDVVVNGITQPLDVKPGKTTTVQLGRLDVDHVEVTREDGTKYSQPGKYTVARKNAAGQYDYLKTQAHTNYQCDSSHSTFVVANFETGRGLDVLPGEYRIFVVYTTAEGNKSQQFDVSIP